MALGKIKARSPIFTLEIPRFEFIPRLGVAIPRHPVPPPGKTLVKGAMGWV